MIEVFHDGSGWRWRMICAAGRVLAYCAQPFDCQFVAFSAAKSYRTAFWMVADSVDHRMARCI